MTRRAAAVARYPLVMSNFMVGDGGRRRILSLVSTERRLWTRSEASRRSGRHFPIASGSDVLAQSRPIGKHRHRVNFAPSSFVESRRYAASFPPFSVCFHVRTGQASRLVRLSHEG